MASRTPRAASRAAASPQAAEPAEAATRVLRRFRLVFNAVKTHFQQVEKAAGIGGAQLWALSVIRADPGIGVGGLAQAMDVHQTTASNLVKSLVALEMVRVEKGDVDRRTVQLRILPSGRAVLRRAPGPFTGVLPDALARLDRRTLERLDRDLAVLLRELKADEKAAGRLMSQM